jgi:hypothetical protein
MGKRNESRKPPSPRENPKRADHRLGKRFTSNDSLLAAAIDGWGTTVRYSLLLILRRSSIGVGLLSIYLLAHRLGVT